MIDLGKSPMYALGVTLFGDHADPGLFHYLPASPRLRRDDEGQPELGLLKYRLDPMLHDVLGGGLLSFTVDLAVDEEVLSALRSRLMTHFDLSEPARLVPVAADEGSCRLLLLDRSSSEDQPAEGDGTDTGEGDDGGGEEADDAAGAGAGALHLVERILGETAPSLYGNNAATFMAVLSREGAGVMEGALRGGTLPAGVVYALRVLGIRPALRARVTARWQDAYEYYENRLHGGALLLAVDIGAILEDLVRDEVIRVEVDELVPPDAQSAVLQQALDRVQTHILDKFFAPTLGQQPMTEESGGLAAIGDLIKGVLGVFTVTYTLREIERSELKTMSWEMNAARAEHLTLSPQGTLAGLLAADEEHPVDVDALITEVELPPNPEMRFDVASAVDLDAEGIDHLEVRLRYGDDEVPLVLDDQTPRAEHTFWFDRDLGGDVTRRYQVHLRAGDEGPDAVLESEETTSAERVIRLNPRELYERVGVEAVAFGVPFDRFPAVIVDLRAEVPAIGYSASETVQLTAETRQAAWRIRVDRGALVRLSRRLRYVDTSGREVCVDWEDVEPGVMAVGDPFPEVLDVQLLGSARFGTHVARVIVELRLTNAPERVDSRVLDLSTPFATWSVPLAEPEERAWEYRVTVHTMRGEIQEGEWRPGRGAKLVVGEHFVELRQVELMLLGSPLPSQGLLGVKVALRYEDPENEVFEEHEQLLTSLSGPLAWSYPLKDPDRKVWSYTLTLIRTDGTQEILEPVTTSDKLAIHPLG